MRRQGFPQVSPAGPPLPFFLLWANSTHTLLAGEQPGRRVVQESRLYLIGRRGAVRAPKWVCVDMGEPKPERGSKSGRTVLTVEGQEAASHSLCSLGLSVYTTQESSPQRQFLRNREEGVEHLEISQKPLPHWGLASTSAADSSVTSGGW